jgi:myosin heavy subunit
MAEDSDTPGWELGGAVFIKDVKKKTDRLWLKGTVTAVEGNSKLHVKLENGTTEFVDMKKATVHTQNPKTGYDDMTSLYYLNEPGVSESLEARYMQDPCNIYSWIGSILIVCNPFTRVPTPDMKDYEGKSLYANPPHNFSVAEAAFAALKKSQGEESQSIIISGESGAGKTESSKICMRYLTAMAKVADGCEGIADRILSVNPILEAFGNGTTTRNWNSSRFGKFTQMEFEEDGKELAGATIQTYLLETSRVVFQMAGERNFHVFYHIFENSSLETSGMGLLPKEQYHYLNQSGTYGAEMVDDLNGENGVSEVIKAITGIMGDGNQNPKEYIQDLYTVIAGILFLGNVNFEGADTATVVDAAPLAAAAKLFGCSLDDLAFALTHESKVLGREKIAGVLGAAGATANRESLARNMYQRCFDDVKDLANRSLTSGDESQQIGVLDIFGFESFEKNTFEQFCINFTNETLQATFNKHVFLGEIKIYEDEGLQAGGITWPDNSEGLKMLEDVFSELHSASSLKASTDQQFNRQLHDKYDRAKKSAWPRTDSRMTKMHFTILHYAGQVVYNVEGWLNKNRDTYTSDISLLCREQCKGNRLVGQLWHTSSGTLTKLDKEGNRTTQRAKFRSLGKEFMKSIHKLTDQIDSTHVHFVRTLKTNKPMKPGYYQPDYVIPQLRDQGLLALCDLLKAGFPSRIDYGALWSS